MVVFGTLAMALPAGAGTGTNAAATAATDLHPADYFRKAADSFAAGRKDEATFWLYVAQLRWRGRLAAHPELNPTGEPALFASLMETIGRPINEYAFGNVAKATAIIDRALAWDAAHPDRSVPEDVRRTMRSGLIGLRDDMRRNARDVRRQRTENGLTNR
ncbi:hypothetical protein BJF93_13950 [Xaviernesmea oryzae]|uniref:Uncharacterized protein n=1 Tax=Xaviernesmea oryzae TaxID=464029 RepID=A0A1Q9ARL4_9HYPH|nr:hypothetical protein BJF93_13950 [Xaviernesmea oryzae]